MLTEKDIIEFYSDLDKLGLKFPVAAISKATGYGKSNVSQYLSRKLQPSESFIEAFYKAFPKSTQNVSRENGQLDLIKEVNRLREQQIESEAKFSALFSELVHLIAKDSGRSHASVSSQLRKDISSEIQNLKTLDRK